MTNDLRTAAQQALKVLSGIRWFGGTTAEQEFDDAVRALRVALGMRAERVTAAPDNMSMRRAVPAEPLFLLHTGKIDSDGEQDEWETEADSGARVDEFCLAHPGQTIGLYPHAAPAAPRQQPLTDEQIDELYIDGKRHWLGKRQIARAIERAHGIKGDSNDWPRDRYQLLCANCNFGKLMNGGICPHQGGARHA